MHFTDFIPCPICNQKPRTHVYVVTPHVYEHRASCACQRQAIVVTLDSDVLAEPYAEGLRETWNNRLISAYPAIARLMDIAISTPACRTGGPYCYSRVALINMAREFLHLPPRE
jgi:hypothetical protein